MSGPILAIIVAMWVISGSVHVLWIINRIPTGSIMNDLSICSIRGQLLVTAIGLVGFIPPVRKWLWSRNDIPCCYSEKR